MVKRKMKRFLWGQKVLEASAHPNLNSRLTPRRKKCPGTK